MIGEKKPKLKLKIYKQIYNDWAIFPFLRDLNINVKFEFTRWLVSNL